MFTNPIYLIYMYKEDLALNNLQWLICHKIQPNQILYVVPSIILQACFVQAFKIVGESWKFTMWLLNIL